MAVKQYSLKTQGETSLSANFKVKEFRCKDGSDAIKICDDLVVTLQAIRNHYGKAVNISSAYRNEKYNTSIKGAKDSQHMEGKAADIRITGVNPRDLARWIEENLWGGLVWGIGLYDYKPSDKSGFVHVDTRVKAKASMWVQTVSTGSAKTVNSIIRDYLGGGSSGGSTTPPVTTTVPLLKLGSVGEDVVRVQEAIITSGEFDSVTQAAVKEWQRKNGLVADGVVGAKSWAKING